MKEKSTAEQSTQRHPVPAGFDGMLQGYIATSGEIAAMILAVAVAREPEKYSDIADLVTDGRAALQIMVRGGLLQLAVIDVHAGTIVGTLFEYGAQVLEARGVPQ